jgi:uncharacterized protein (DUF1330 family)
MSCYFVARISIHDPETYERYLSGTTPLLTRWGAKVLAVDETVTVLEGQWPASRTVIIEFPDEASASAWYASPEYQAIARHRWSASDADAILVMGRAEAPNKGFEPMP